MTGVFVVHSDKDWWLWSSRRLPGIGYSQAQRAGFGVSQSESAKRRESPWPSRISLACSCRHRIPDFIKMGKTTDFIILVSVCLLVSDF